MFKVTKTQWSVAGRQNDYLCTSVNDISKLPRYKVRGSQEENDVIDGFSNEPCMYGSTALVVDPSLDSSKLYILNADNSWTEFK